MKAWVLLVLVALHPRSETWGTQGVGAAATVEFGFERPVAKMSYHFVLREDGSGTYTATYPPAPPATPGETVDMPLRLRAATAKKIFEQARSTVVLHGNCETKAKNIAQTGMKSLTYTDAQGTKAACAWNYSDKPAVTGLQEEFIAMAATLDLARKLKMEQRFDRLSMDRDVTYLLEAAKGGQAQGLENVAPILQAIADDESLLERVRMRARQLLEMGRAER